MSKFSLWDFNFIELIENHFGLSYKEITKAIEKYKKENMK